VRRKPIGKTGLNAMIGNVIREQFIKHNNVKEAHFFILSEFSNQIWVSPTEAPEETPLLAPRGKI
jgi:hypothetical protein